jgi:uncharacterized tellurite resistance protein B-like protein
MIIFGTRGITSTISEGDFHCPQCNNSQNYRHREVQKYFTLYFIPIIPLGSAGEYVECRNCKGTFVPRILEQGAQNAEFMALYEEAMRHSMIKMMLADGVIDDNEKRLVIEIINRFGNNDIDEAQFDRLVRNIQTDTKDVTHYLKEIAGSLNEHGKETIIKCALHIAFADGEFDESEKQMIIQMGEALEMSTSHLKGIFTEIFADDKIA